MKTSVMFNAMQARFDEVKRVMISESENDRKQISAMSRQIEREYGELSRRLAAVEDKINKLLLAGGFEK